MAELHIIGEVDTGHDFGGQSYFCVFEIIAGSQWTVVEGLTSGCTHIMRSGEGGVVPWCFPVDVHYAFHSLQGWPKVSLQVWQVDGYGRKDLAGYGMAYLPIPAKGDIEEQVVEVATWRPAYWNPSFFKRFYETFRLFIMGGVPVLRDNSLIYSNEERFKLHTVGSGTVRIKLNTFSRGMKRAGMILNR